MNKFEKIKNMSVDEMARLLKKYASRFLVLKVNGGYIDDDLIKQWLLSEV